MKSNNERPDILTEDLIQVNNVKKIDFTKPYTFIYQQFWFDLIAKPFYMLCFICAEICAIFFFGMKIVDRKKARKTMKEHGCIVVSNHCHYFDTVLMSATIFPTRLNVSVVQRNFEVPIVRRILRLTYAFPIPSSPSGLKQIHASVAEALRRKQHVMVLPEGNLVQLSQKIHRFRLGAFQQAYEHQAPIVPTVYVLKRRKIFGKELPKNWIKMYQIFGDPIFPPLKEEGKELPREQLLEMASNVANWMEDTINKYQNK